MFYVWAVVTAEGLPIIDTIEPDSDSAIAKFLRTRPPGHESRLDWNAWQALGYTCERFRLSKENGRER
ncbi:MAG TPA: hypothetical protein VGN57_17755 [Pirellulaceae bacterium]|jgi:hypothetical protein|nr:hypothetical protein [Pirellulaceae bacterium]